MGFVREAKSYVNFKDSCPPKVEAYLRSLVSGDGARSSCSNSFAGTTAHTEGIAVADGNLSGLNRTMVNVQNLVNPGWLKMPAEQEVLQRFNSAPSPPAFPHMQHPQNGILGMVLPSRKCRPCHLLND